MAWGALVVLALALWGGCGAVIALGRRIWSLETTLYVHLAAAPALAFAVATIHASLFPGFGPAARAAAMTALVVLLDAAVVAPLFERSFAMFRSVIGTWAPFAAIFLASVAAGCLARA